MTNVYRLNVYTVKGCKKTDSKKIETARKNFDFFTSCGCDTITKVEIIDRASGNVLASWTA